MLGEHFVWIIPLTGGSGSELGFWLTLFLTIITALAARTGILEVVKIIKQMNEGDNPDRVYSSWIAESFRRLFLFITTLFFIYVTIALLQDVILTIL